jgi:hypothetical protein
VVLKEESTFLPGKRRTSVETEVPKCALPQNVPVFLAMWTSSPAQTCFLALIFVLPAKQIIGCQFLF